MVTLATTLPDLGTSGGGGYGGIPTRAAPSPQPLRGRCYRCPSPGVGGAARGGMPPGNGGAAAVRRGRPQPGCPATGPLRATATPPPTAPRPPSGLAAGSGRQGRGGARRAPSLGRGVREAPGAWSGQRTAAPALLRPGTRPNPRSKLVLTGSGGEGLGPGGGGRGRDFTGWCPAGRQVEDSASPPSKCVGRVSLPPQCLWREWGGTCASPSARVVGGD